MLISREKVNNLLKSVLNNYIQYENGDYGTSGYFCVFCGERASSHDYDEAKKILEEFHKKNDCVMNTAKAMKRNLKQFSIQSAKASGKLL